VIAWQEVILLPIEGRASGNNISICVCRSSRWNFYEGAYRNLIL